MIEAFDLGIDEKDEMVASIEIDKFQNMKGKLDVKPLNWYEM